MCVKQSVPMKEVTPATPAAPAAAAAKTVQTTGPMFKAVAATPFTVLVILVPASVRVFVLTAGAVTDTPLTIEVIVLTGLVKV